MSALEPCLHGESLPRRVERAPDPEQTAVLVLLPTKSGGTLRCSCTVRHHGTEIVDVLLPPWYRSYAAAVGVDRDAVCFEGYVETLARIEFARGGR